MMSMDDDMWDEEPPNQQDVADVADMVDPLTKTPAFPKMAMRGAAGPLPDSLEEQIERLNKRLKRNLPNQVRSERHEFRWRWAVADLVNLGIHPTHRLRCARLKKWSDGRCARTWRTT